MTDGCAFHTPMRVAQIYTILSVPHESLGTFAIKNDFNKNMGYPMSARFTHPSGRRRFTPSSWCVTFRYPPYALAGILIFEQSSNYLENKGIKYFCLPKKYFSKNVPQTPLFFSYI